MVWDINPVAFTFGEQDYRYYGLFFIVALLTGYFGSEFMVKRHRPGLFNVDVMMLGVVLLVAPGARLFHLLFYQTGEFFSDPMMFFNFREGGLASHGVMAFLLAWCFGFARFNRVPFVALADIVATFIPLACSWIRLGNFCNSEIVGRPAQVPWAVTFVAYDPVPRHPAQLYEWALLVGVFVLCYWGVARKNWLEVPGRTVGAFFFGYFGGRLFVEMFKELQVPAAEQLMTMGQWLSLIPAAFGAYMIWVYPRTAKPKGRDQN